jgi:hypothetical protein
MGEFIMNIEDKNDLVQKLAEKLTENADLKDLERFYYESQELYLSELSDEELLTIAKDMGEL